MPCTAFATRLTRSDEKRLATAQARCALWGGVLTPIESDTGRPAFIVTRWSLTRAFTDLQEVEGFLDRVEAAAA